MAQLEEKANNISINISIRKMTLDDVENVASLETKSLGNEAWSEKSFIDTLSKDYYTFYVAYIDDKHVGTVGFTRSLDEADISNVAVSEEYRGNGIGYALLLKAMEDMTNQGVLHYTLEVRQQNVNAIKLYEKLGFISEGIRPNFYSNPNDNAVIMWKHI